MDISAIASGGLFSDVGRSLSGKCLLGSFCEAVAFRKT